MKSAPASTREKRKVCGFGVLSKRILGDVAMRLKMQASWFAVKASSSPAQLDPNLDFTTPL